IGRNTCENLIKHTKNKHITLINRTKEKAERIAGKFNLTVKDFSELQAEIQQSDVLVVATGAQNPTVDANILNLRKPLLILDLSVPKNVDANVLQTQGVSLIHMDELSKITDDTLEKRRAQIPAAERILEEVKQEFLEWTKVRKFAPTIGALKQKLQEIKNSEIDFQSKKLSGFNEEQAEIISNRIIQKITTHFANHLKDDDTSVEESIFLINKIFQLEQTPETEQKASISFSN
ncbi:MAG: glutamyl-tRNA reductase, partial [Flavobacterium sp.]